ncbi:MAG: hypothetical protein ABI743_12645 [bacterium]
MPLDTRPFDRIVGIFRRQYALEIGTQALCFGSLAALAVIGVDKAYPFPVAWDPAWPALGAGAGVAVIAGLIAHQRRYKLEEAARAIDAHFALQEQLGSAQDPTVGHDLAFQAALTERAAVLANAENYAKGFRLRPPRYTRQASAATAFALALAIAPPFSQLLPAKRAEAKELKARETQLHELAKELREIKPQDKKMQELAQEVDDLAVRAEKNRLSKEDFLKELDDLQKQLETQMKAIDKEGQAKALKEFEQSLDSLQMKEGSKSNDLAAKMEALQNELKSGNMKYDQLDKLQAEMKAQQEKLQNQEGLEKLAEQAGKMREEALKQQEKKLDGEQSRLADELKKEANALGAETPQELKKQLQEQADNLQKESQKGELNPQSLEKMQQQVSELSKSNPSAASKMQSELDQMKKASQAEKQAGAEKQAQAQMNQKASNGKQGEAKADRGQQTGSKNDGSTQGQQGKGQEGQGKEGQQAASPTQNPQGGDQGQQAVEQYISQQGGAEGGQGQPMDNAPEMKAGDGNEGNGQSSGSKSNFSSMSKSEMEDWAKMLAEYKDLDSAKSKAGQCRGGKPGQGGGGAGGNGWGLGHNPDGSPSDQGAGQAPTKPGMDTKQDKRTLEQMGEFSALYDPHIMDGQVTNSEKVNGKIGEGESAGFTMIKAPNTEEGDATTPYFDVSAETIDSEVQALEDQEIPANLKDLVRDYFAELDQ